MRLMMDTASTPFVRHFAERCFGIEPRLWSHAPGHVEGLLAARHNLPRLRRFAAACPVHGVAARDYAPVQLSLPSGCKVIASIHFRAMKTTFPFVDVSAQTGPVSLSDDLEPLRAAFARFQPLSVRLWSAAADELPSEAEPDMFVVGASLSHVLEQPNYPNHERLRLVPVSTLGGYAEYCAAYKAVHAHSPWLVGHVEPVGEVTMAECVRLRTFFRVLVDGKRAGFIAARPSTFRCWRGWEMVDEVLLPDYQGRGLAKAMQHRLASKLAGKRHPCLYGTIWANNTPSLRTACGLGRQIVERSGFVRFA